MKTTKKHIAVLLLCLGAAAVSAQQVNTLYFLEDAPTRHYINPAYQPTSDGYFLLPAIGWTSFSLMNNSITLRDFIYPNTLGQTATFMHPNATPEGPGTQQFYNKLRRNMQFSTDMQVNLLSFGFRVNQHYFHFTLNERFDAMIGMKKDIFGLILNGGMNNIEGNNYYSMKNTRLDATLYTELGLGYSYDLNEQWKFGAKVKYLYGSAHASFNTSDLQANLSPNEWQINGNGVLMAAGPFGGTNPDGSLYESAPVAFTDTGAQYYIQPFSTNYFKPKGHGVAFDLGATYKPIEQLTISLAVADLGFIYWKNGYRYNAKVNATYNGIGEFNYEDYTDTQADGTKTFNTDRLVDTITTHLQQIADNAISTEEPTKGYAQMITAKINAGVDANFFDNQLGVGIFSQTKFYHTNVYEEVTLGIAYRPRSWFNIAASYSFLNGRWSNIGAGIVLRGGPIGLTLTADYIPLVYTQKININDNFGVRLPYNVKGFNLGMGISIQFGYKSDKDKDGVKDRFDLCPDTPRKIKVDKNGCPFDEDGDGVPDYLDECPGTPESAYGLIDKKGCPIDSDKDGVPDYIDRCPNTPEGVEVDSVGCPLDEDGDGVPDYLDKCPGTPHGVVVGQDGCPLDSDGDGVLDVDDECPNTPVEAYGTVDEKGCPKDSDKDGVPDYIDECPNTPHAVGEKQLEKNARYVDNVGCETDLDGDGIPDWRDNCITIPGPESNNGCPELTQEVKTLFQRALNGIQFETASDKIKPKSYPILNEVADLILKNDNWNVEIQGHTDSDGSDAYNLDLSQRRAESVKAYLINRGVPESQLTAKGFGESLPVASNKTAAGKAKNRRVVFNVTYEEVTYEVIKM